MHVKKEEKEDRMNKFGIALAAIVVAATSLRGAEPITPSVDNHHVLSFAASTTSGDIEYRYMFHDSRLAAIAILGYDQQSSKSSSSSSSGITSQVKFHMLDLGVGLRNNFMTREQLRPFVQVDVLRSSASSGCGSRYASPYWNYSASGGAEYFLGKRLSVEGRAGLRYAHASLDCSFLGVTQTFSARTAGTFRSALAINFYF